MKGLSNIIGLFCLIGCIVCVLNQNNTAAIFAGVASYAYFVLGG